MITGFEEAALIWGGGGLRWATEATAGSCGRVTEVMPRVAGFGVGFEVAGVITEGGDLRLITGFVEAALLREGGGLRWATGADTGTSCGSVVAVEVEGASGGTGVLKSIVDSGPSIGSGM